VIYLCTVALSVTANRFADRPGQPPFGRYFRQRARAALVASGHALALAGLATLGLAVTGCRLV